MDDRCGRQGREASRGTCRLLGRLIALCGRIALIDEGYVVPEISREFHPGYVFAPTQYVAPARGDVHIPAGAPKLRALEIYNRRITEQGLPCLHLCKRLDSIQIKSTAPVSEYAVMRLKTELPNLQTVDISQSEPRGRVARPVAMRRR